MADFKHNCSSCRVREACEYTFGRYWQDKSSNGAGCEHQISNFDVETIKDKLSKEEISRLSRPCEIETHHKYVVSCYDGREFTVAAKSEKDAINHVRYRHFGNLPMNILGEFKAYMIKGTGRTERPAPTKQDILSRIRKMKGY